MQYEHGVNSSHWMDAQYVLPLIVYKWNIPKLVLYGTVRNDDGEHYFVTTTFSYSGERNRVLCNKYVGLIEPEPYDLCIVHVRQINHVMYLRLTV